MSTDALRLSVFKDHREAGQAGVEYLEMRSEIKQKGSVGH